MMERVTKKVMKKWGNNWKGSQGREKRQSLEIVNNQSTISDFLSAHWKEEGKVICICSSSLPLSFHSLFHFLPPDYGLVILDIFSGTRERERYEQHTPSAWF